MFTNLIIRCMSNNKKKSNTYVALGCMFLILSMTIEDKSSMNFYLTFIPAFIFLAAAIVIGKTKK